jgi:hypothetical protein
MMLNLKIQKAQHKNYSHNYKLKLDRIFQKIDKKLNSFRVNISVNKILKFYFDMFKKQVRIFTPNRIPNLMDMLNS